MDGKSNNGLGCGTFVMVGLAVVLAVVVGFGFCTYRVFNSKRHMATERARDAGGRGGLVTLREEALPDYAGYPKGGPLGRETFLAWKLDPRRTSIGEQSFREKAEGASVSWFLQIEDIETRGDGLLANCVVPYELKHRENLTSSSRVTVLCEFASSAKDSLLPLRRGDWVEISGRVSLGSDEAARILDAQVASQVVEKP